VCRLSKAASLIIITFILPVLQRYREVALRLYEAARVHEKRWRYQKVHEGPPRSLQRVPQCVLYLQAEWPGHENQNQGSTGLLNSVLERSSAVVSNLSCKFVYKKIESMYIHFLFHCQKRLCYHRYRKCCFCAHKHVAPLTLMALTHQKCGACDTTTTLSTPQKLTHTRSYTVSTLVDWAEWAWADSARQ